MTSSACSFGHRKHLGKHCADRWMLLKLHDNESFDIVADVGLTSDEGGVRISGVLPGPQGGTIEVLWWARPQCKFSSWSWLSGDQM